MEKILQCMYCFVFYLHCPPMNPHILYEILLATNKKFLSFVILISDNYEARTWMSLCNWSLCSFAGLCCFSQVLCLIIRGVSRSNFLLRQLTQFIWPHPLLVKPRPALTSWLTIAVPYFGHLSWTNTTYDWIIMSFSTIQYILALLPIVFVY